MSKAVTIVAVFIYAALLLALWIGLHDSLIGKSLTQGFPRVFASSAVLLAPLWLVGFGVGEPLRRIPGWRKIVAAAVLAVPYFIYAAGTPIFNWRGAVIVVAFPGLLAAFVGLPKLPAAMAWRDAAALFVIVMTYYMRWLQSAWPPELAFMSKLFLADVTLYCFLVVRKVEGSGYALVPTRSGFLVGAREWVYFLPLAAGLGELTGFIHFHAILPSPARAIATVLVTLLLIAIPEELFFRAVLQNLLETRLGRTCALIVTAGLFGLSHFNHGSRFNWRYVLLAILAGIFYGRAWRAHRQIFASIVTHTAVDVVWSLWFR